MAMDYEELDDKTRQYMLAEFEREEVGGNPYRSKALSSTGLAVFPQLMREAIESGNEVSVCRALENASYWELEEEYTRDGITRARQEPKQVRHWRYPTVSAQPRFVATRTQACGPRNSSRNGRDSVHSARRCAQARRLGREGG